MEVEIIRSIQSVSSEFLDGLYYLFTQCGQVVFFLGIFAITYWCISTNEAIKIGLIYCISALFNNGVKFLVKRPRPYLVDPTLSLVDIVSPMECLLRLLELHYFAPHATNGLDIHTLRLHLYLGQA